MKRNTASSKPGWRVSLMRLVGLALILATGYIFWYTVSEGRPRDFWDPARYTSRANIYKLPGVWHDQSGQKIDLAEFQDKPAIVSFVYMNCRMTCPRIMADLRGIESSLGKKADDVRFLVYLFEDARNQPKKIKKFMTLYNISGPRWRVLTGSARDLKRVADEFRLVYKKGPSGKYSYMHTNFFALLTPKGKVLREFRGLQADGDKFQARVRETLKEFKESEKLNVRETGGANLNGDNQNRANQKNGI